MKVFNVLSVSLLISTVWYIKGSLLRNVIRFELKYAKESDSDLFWREFCQTWAFVGLLDLSQLRMDMIKINKTNVKTAITVLFFHIFFE